MKRNLALIFLIVKSLTAFSQEKAFSVFLSDSCMRNAGVSFSVITADSAKVVFCYNSEKSLIPASVLKLVTSSAALEILGPDHIFKTRLGYSGTLNKRSGKLNGDIIIRGGGDPALGSSRFAGIYNDFTGLWVKGIKDAGIRKVSGRVITDDSYFDYLPVPAKWLWEDAGNYYGAGAYGLSVYDNSYEIHFRTSADSLSQIITGINPKECNFEFKNWLVAAGTSDEGYIFAAPYSTNGWLAGSIPVSPDDYTLMASIADPPLIMAKVLDNKLRSEKIMIADSPSTSRLLQSGPAEGFVEITSTSSPPLSDIIVALNHESVNLYAEHLAKELAKVNGKGGSTEAGIKVINEFLANAGINTNGVFLEDGSGLSPLDAVNSSAMTSLLFYMKNKGKYFREFYASLPEAGKEGTLKNRFRDPVFEGRLVAKSGSMTRVRSYAGYIHALSGKDLVFCIIVNNFSGASAPVISGIEEILAETIRNN
jgi:serine-type D-Ala-D-Ala carboxypeptidase/endopeptidase (penicillin-binding protein 4)